MTMVRREDRERCGHRTLVDGLCVTSRRVIMVRVKPVLVVFWVGGRMVRCRGGSD